MVNNTVLLKTLEFRLLIILQIYANRESKNWRTIKRIFIKYMYIKYNVNNYELLEVLLCDVHVTGYKRTEILTFFLYLKCINIIRSKILRDKILLHYFE